MPGDEAQQIVKGIAISALGEATVDPALTEVLFDLALELEEPTRLPVDVEHVLAAIVLAAQAGEISPEVTLTASDPQLVALLTSHVKTIFAKFDGRLGKDD